MTPINEVGRKRPQLRLWPGVAAVVLQWLFWFGLPVVAPAYGVFGLLGGVICGLVVLVWWLFFSRVPRLERWTAIPLIIIAVFAAPVILHPSIVGGMMGRMPKVYLVPFMSLALVAWAVVSRRLSVGASRAALALAIFAGCAALGLLRTDGITGEGRAQLAWRWSQNAEQQLLARGGAELPAAPPPAAPSKEIPKDEPAPKSAEAPAAAPPKAAADRPTARDAATIPVDWAGFRGPRRDGVVNGVRIATDWATSKPAELWRRPIGPGWSSFAVGGGRLYTQEQRGNFELVVCYNAATGDPLWTHRDSARFYESNGGPGPRGTPTLHNGRIYSLGATGILNALDAANGAVVWTRNAVSDTGAKIPGWGITSSPLVVDNVVIVAASGRLAGYDLDTGKPRWVRREGGASYGSPHLLTIGEVQQVVLLTSIGATSVSPRDGSVLWKHEWPGSTILQPAITSDGGVLVTTGDMMGGLGTRRLAVSRTANGWSATEQWTSKGLKPYFNDLVVHGNHAFGFDGSILSCIDLKDGSRKWKGGRYGNGQMLLLGGEDVLLVLSEEGELALVSAMPTEFKELARFKAIEGKTWNHPVLIGDVVFVRNGEEMAAFRLPRGNP